MGLLLNLAALVVIWLAYSVIIAVAQNMLLWLVIGLFRARPTSTVAACTAFLASLFATVTAVACGEYGVRAFHGSLSAIPIATWGVLQLLGASQSFGRSRSSMSDMGARLIAGGDADAPKFSFAGQFAGLQVGLVAALVLHFFI